MISKDSKHRIKELLRREYNWINDEIEELRDLIKKKRSLKENTISGGVRLECWKMISQYSNRMEKLKKRRKGIQKTIKEIKSEY